MSLFHFTDCSCSEPGWCERHQCQKSWRLFHLCRRSRQAFQAWENGQGPGLGQRAANLAAAVVRHVATGAECVDEVTAEMRLDICRTCEFCDVPHMVCRQVGCGCYLKVKATWKSQSCPANKWPSLSLETVRDMS